MTEVVWSSKDKINSAIALAGLVGVVIGLFFTGFQIRQAAVQLEAATIYTMQKDGSALFDEFSSDPRFVDYVFNYDPAKRYDDSLVSEARLKMGRVIQFFSRIHNQHLYGAMGAEAWAVARHDLCGFIRNEPWRTVWKDNLESRYADAFRDAVNLCFEED